ncbi:Glycosyltransferase involved in cell wall bisynthesis [Flavobacterium swingsii]|uniref:Glycosyltransferase involved in cell wall bisynthesis n=1 Tax=Flavobacterium swingsii TaxID=498292 RepID=A0A1I0WKF9_9FLAO|nr:glycosyltransferase family 4 protein [Flavobacterium swingsii]SFA88708.1 Glycosyltransferase involved in cell wall bisynthesis [Flavobacterium swingsii]
MKILYITPDLTNSGGIARVISLKTNYFVSVFNYEVHILAANTTNAGFFYDFNEKIKWYTIADSKKSLFFLWNYLRLIKKVIAEKKPDIIIVCDAVLWVSIPWIIKTKIPILFETHVSRFLKKTDSQSKIDELKQKAIHSIKQITLNKFDKVIFLSQENSNEWKLKNAEIIPNPISFTSQKKSNLQSKKAIAATRHSYEKGLDRLLFVWKKITLKYPDWTLDIYGQWENDLTYQQMASSLQISSYVNFIAPTKDIQTKYLESSLYLMTSRSEAFPLVLIEAMGCGLPCIAYDCPCGPRAIINDKEDGFLIENGNESDFVNTIITLIENEDLRLKIGESAKISSQKYNIDSVMQIWKNLLED